jgi:ribosomal protein S18 acetylase RimI-like enzyme
MAAELGESPPPAEAPHGIDVAPFRPEDLPDLYAAIDDAFESDWRFASGLEDFRVKWLGRERARPDLWLVAREEDTVAGALVAEWKRNGDLGWIEWIGVRPAWRRRGVGRALLVGALRRFHDLGERRVGLGVDAANPTGATRLYEALGMRRTSEAVVYEKPL